MGSVILFSSVTWALRAQKILEKHGVRSAMKKIANSPKLGGCGYGLEIYGNTQAALHLLQAGNIRIVDVL